MNLTAVVAAAALALLVPSASARAAPQAGPTPEFVCGLVTKTEVEKEIGRELSSDPDAMRMGGAAVCDFPSPLQRSCDNAHPGCPA